MFGKTNNPLAHRTNNEIAFIDTSISGHDRLLAGIRDGVEVVLIDSEQDGMAQIAAALLGRSGVDAIHIFSHGASGMLQLGTSQLTEASIGAYGAELSVLRSALSAGGDLLLYGCDVARGPEGEAFVGALAAATGADVAASENASGNALLGGDWELETHTGAVDVLAALTAQGQAAFGGLLAVADFDSLGLLITPGRGTQLDAGAWRFTSSVAVNMAVADGVEIPVWMNNDGGPSDRAFVTNFTTDAITDPIVTGPVTYTMKLTDASHFKLNSLTIGQLVGGTPNVTISAYSNGTLVVAGATINLASSSSSGGLSYNFITSDPDYGRYGTLTFSSAYNNIDELRIAFGATADLHLDDINVATAVPDTTAPSVSGNIGVPANGSYRAGQVLSFTVTLDENVTIAGTDSTLGLTIGAAARSASYASKTANSITYAYTVQAGDADTDGISIGAIALNTTTVRDAAANNANLSLAGHLPATAAVLVDTTAPAVSGTLAVPSDDTYRVGETLTFVVTFGENVNVTGTGSALGLNIGGISRSASYASKTANSVTYSYTVQAGDSDADGIGITGLSLNGSTIRDAAGNDASLVLSGHLPSLAGVLVDAVAPSVSGNIAVPANASYKAGEVLAFTVTFNENVSVTGSDSTLGLTVGGAARSAVFLSSTANSITYAYTVQAGDADGDGIAVGAIALGGSTVRDAAGNDATLALAGHLPSTAGILVDTATPAVARVSVPANDTYVAGEHLDFTVNFDENVTVTGGGSTLGLTVGSTARSAQFLSASGNAVTYRYTVQAGDLDANGITIGSLALGGSTIRDAAGNDAVLTLNSVGSTANVLVDGSVPSVQGNIAAPADRIYVVGDTLTFTVTFDENVTVSGTGSKLALNIGNTVRYASYDSKTGNSVTYTYTVQNGDNDGDGIAVTGIALNGDTIQDASGNNASLDLTGHLPALAGVLVDGGPPSVSGMIAVPANASYKAGDVLSFTVSFDENVTVAGSDSELGLSIGSSARAAAFSSSTANSITYTYTVQAGDSDANGITVGGITANTTTIRDVAGNDADLTLATHVPATTGILVDTAAPAVASVSVPASATYVAGQHLDFTVDFGEHVTVMGSDSTLGLTIGSTARSAIYLSASGATVTYRYTVQAGDADADGVSMGSLALGGSTMRDAAGNNAVLTLNGIGATANVLVDATAPTVSGTIGVPADGVYITGQTLSFTVSFEENVTVTGTGSTLGLNIGGTARSAAYSSKTANSITYTYTVQAGDSDSDGIAVGTIALGGSTVRDAAGNNAALALTGHLPPLAGVRIDNAGPVLASATVNASTLVMGFTDDTVLDAAHAPPGSAFAVTVAGVAVAVSSVVVDAAARTVTLTLASAVANGQAVTVAYTDPSGGNDANAIQDAVGNDAASMSTSAVNTTPIPSTPPPRPPTTTVDGVPVITSTDSQDGTVVQVVTVPVVTPSRQEQVGNNTVADIPLLKDAQGNSLLLLQVPTGIGLQASGTAQPKAADSSLTDLIREINARTASDSADQNLLTSAANGFLGGLSVDTPVLVQTIMIGGNKAADGTPLGIIGQAQGGRAVQTALVIDARGVPDGAALELQNVEFAAVIGAATVTGGNGSQHVWGDGASQTIILGADDDVLHGGGGDDIVGSAGGNDMVYGDAGNDLVFGGEGNDYLDGGAGRDIARFAGAAGKYSLRMKDGQLLITDRAGGEGADTVAAVETLRFTGGQSSATDAVLARLYEGVLHRSASAAEVAFWHDMHTRGVSLHDIAAAIVSSAEGAETGGGGTDAVFVAGLYQSALGRTAAATEIAWWTGALANGADRAVVALAFVNSPEKLAMALDLDFNHSDVAVLVRMYHAMFGRAPDESGLNWWLGAHEGGLSLGAIADAFVASPEAKARQQGDDGAFIDLLYQTALERAPTAAEKAQLLDYLQHGVFDRGQVLLDIAESVESIAIVGSISTSLDLS